MIEVNGEEVKVGKASGNQLLDEAARAIHGVFLTLKKNLYLPAEVSDKQLMIFVLSEVGKRLARVDSDSVKDFSVINDKSDSFDKIFGDLFKGDK